MGRFHAGAVEGIDINDKLDLVIVVIPEMRDLNESASGPAGSIRLSPKFIDPEGLTPCAFVPSAI